jgi:hypothetical protein
MKNNNTLTLRHGPATLVAWNVVNVAAICMLIPPVAYVIDWDAITLALGQELETRPAYNVKMAMMGAVGLVLAGITHPVRQAMAVVLAKLLARILPARFMAVKHPLYEGRVQK